MLKSVFCALTGHNYLVVFLCSVRGQNTGGGKMLHLNLKHFLLIPYMGTDTDFHIPYF
jgi:hypothetical protein